MLICICTNTRPHEGGVTTTINNSAKALRLLGQKVDVITLWGKSDYRKVRTSLTKKSDKLLKKNPYLTFFVYQLSKIILLFRLFFWTILKKYDVIISTDFSATNISYWIKRWFAVPIIALYLGEVEELIDQGKINKGGWQEKFFKKEEKKSLSRANTIFHIEERTSSKKLEKINPGKIPIYPFHIPIDFEKFSPNPKKRKEFRAKYKIADDEFLILFVGRLAPRKGPLYPAMALKKLLEESDHFKLLYVGEGPEKIFIHKFIKNNSIENKVIFAGTISYSELSNYYRMADCIMFTSTDENKNIIEPISLVVYEAMLCDLPVIAFDSGVEMSDQKVFLKHGENCLIVLPKDFNQLAESVKKIKNDDKIKNTLVTGGRKSVIEGGWSILEAGKNILDKILKLK